MPESALARKLLIKPGFRLRLIDPPPGYTEALSPLPDGASIPTGTQGRFDFVQLFARSRADVDAGAANALAALKPGGVFWVSFPKGSSKVQTDLTRDRGWEGLHALGWQLVSLVSIDDTWSAARIRPIVASKTRKS